MEDIIRQREGGARRRCARRPRGASRARAGRRYLRAEVRATLKGGGVGAGIGGDERRRRARASVGTYGAQRRATRGRTFFGNGGADGVFDAAVTERRSHGPYAIGPVERGGGGDFCDPRAPNKWRKPAAPGEGRRRLTSADLHDVATTRPAAGGADRRFIHSTRRGRSRAASHRSRRRSRRRRLAGRRRRTPSPSRSTPAAPPSSERARTSSVARETTRCAANAGRGADGGVVDPPRRARGGAPSARPLARHAGLRSRPNASRRHEVADCASAHGQSRCSAARRSSSFSEPCRHRRRRGRARAEAARRAS